MSPQERIQDTHFRLACISMAAEGNPGAMGAQTKEQQLATAKIFYDWVVPDSRRDTNVLQFRLKEKSPAAGTFPE